MNSISVLPIWKKGASLADRLDELASYVRANPECFKMFVAAFLEEHKDGSWKIRQIDCGCNLAESIGLYEMAKRERITESEL